MRQSLLNAVVGAFGVDVEYFVVVGFIGVFERLEFSDTGIDEQNVDFAEFVDDGGVKAIEVGEFGDISFCREDTVAKKLYSFVKRFLAAAGDGNFCALLHKASSGGETDTAVAAGDDGYFSCKAFHESLQ